MCSAHTSQEERELLHTFSLFAKVHHPQCLGRVGGRCI